MNEVRALQERAARGMPAEVVETADGWWLRHQPGPAWWVRSVLPHGDGDLAARVAAAEAFGADHGVPARIQVTPGVCPDELDGLLAARGYRRASEAALLTAPVRPVAAALTAELADRPSAGWFAAWHAVNGGDADAERALLDRVERPSAYAAVRQGGEVVAVGRTVLDGGWAGVFGLATRPAARGRGAGKAVLAALSGWAAEHGATGLYLQVAADNPAALRLYAGAGFTSRTEYHYRFQTA